MSPTAAYDERANAMPAVSGTRCELMLAAFDVEAATVLAADEDGSAYCPEVDGTIDVFAAMGRLLRVLDRAALTCEPVRAWARVLRDRYWTLAAVCRLHRLHGGPEDARPRWGTALADDLASCRRAIVDVLRR